MEKELGWCFSFSGAMSVNSVDAAYGLLLFV